VSLNLECLVYPAPVPYRSALHPENAEPGAGELKSATGAEDFEGLKPYQPGESLRHIAWKAYSRGRGLMLKSFSGRAGASVMLSWRHTPGSDAEQRLSRLCHGVMQADRRNLTYGLVLPNRTIAAGAGPAHKRACLKALALYNQ
jgi:uncharacterized protein (DUF58 family)